MRSILATVAAAAMAVSAIGVSRAAAAPPPTTAPSSPDAVQQQQQQQAEDPRPRVLVMPFDELADSPKREWVGKAMQQSLIAELTRSGMVAVMTPPADAPRAADAKAAAKLARDVQAPLVIVGSYQLLDQDLRVTGQMLESINGESVAAIKATGNLRDLFSVEDVIGNQVRRDLQAILNPQPQRPGQRSPSGDPFNVQPSGPVQQQQPTGAYTGSDLQRSLDDQWAPPEPTYQDRYDRQRYSYPPPYYYPPYGYPDYYDWCGYTFRPGRIITTVPIVPAGPQRPFSQQNNNYITAPGQLGRTSGGNFIQGPPGQMGRTTAGRGNSNSIQSPPGQMDRTGGNTSAGSHSSTGAPGQMRGSR